MNQLYRLTGSRPGPDSTVELDECVAFIDYPTDTTWQADITLELGRSEYNYRTITNGIESSWMTLHVSLESAGIEQIAAFNTLDLHGTFFDTKRLKGEKNQAYKDRLLDAVVHRGSANFRGLNNAITRDLGLDYDDRAIRITRAQDPTTGKEWAGLSVEVSDTYVRLASPQFVKTRELIAQHPIEGFLAPSEYVLGDVTVETLDLKVITEIRFDHRLNRIYLPDPSMAGQDMLLTYTYEKRVDRTDLTVGEVATVLEAVVTPNGNQLITAAVSATVEDEDAAGLSVVPLTEITRHHTDAAGATVGYLPVRWSSVFMHQIADREFQDNFRSASGSIHGTKISSYAHALRKLSKSTWGSLVADESVWSSVDYPIQGGQYLDTIFDADLSSNIPEAFFQSGVGCCLSLKTVLGDIKRPIGSEEEDDHITADNDLDQPVPSDEDPTQGGIEVA